jgi:hypothetical protein
MCSHSTTPAEVNSVEPVPRGGRGRRCPCRMGELVGVRMVGVVGGPGAVVRGEIRDGGDEAAASSSVVVGWSETRTQPGLSVWSPRLIWSVMELGMRAGDVQEVMAVGAGAGAAAAALDAEAVVEQPDGEVVVQAVDVEGDDAEAVAVLVGEEVQAGDGRRRSQTRSRSSCSRRWMAATPMASFRRMQRAMRMAWVKPGVPPSSRASMSSKYLCSPQGLVQSTVPPPGCRARGWCRVSWRR